MSVATCGSRCSALSISKSTRFAASASTSVSSTVTPGRSRTSSAFATASSASAGSRSAASEIHQTPSGRSSATSAAACSASLVFPVPPGPVSVSNRTSSRPNRPTTSSSSRLAAEKRRRRDGEVRLVQGLQAREIGVAQLEEALRRREVLEPVFAEVAYGVACDEVARRLRQEHLAPVPGGSDARRAVDVDPDVALVGHDGLARVEPHADADRPAAKRRLPIGGGPIASEARANATKNASPCVSTSTPPCRAKASRNTRRWSLNSSA